VNGRLKAPKIAVELPSFVKQLFMVVLQDGICWDSTHYTVHRKVSLLPLARRHSFELRRYPGMRLEASSHYWGALKQNA
jgi:hypothetical protein